MSNASALKGLIKLGISSDFIAIQAVTKGISFCIGSVLLVMAALYFVEASLEIRALIEDIEELHSY